MSSPYRALSNFKAQNGVYRAVLHQNREVTDKFDPHDTYFLQLTVNGKKAIAIRNTDNCGPVLVDKRLVTENDIIPGKFALCSGAFDGKDSVRAAKYSHYLGSANASCQRTSAKFPRVYTRTKRYSHCSFINFALNNYQDKIQTQQQSTCTILIPTLLL